MMNVRLTYSRLPDLERMKRNWNKTLGLFDRGEYSVAIIRAVTAVELACNWVIREELVRGLKLPSGFVDRMMVWANGPHGKYDKLILPICEGTPRFRRFKAVRKHLDKIWKERNSVVHQGQFKGKATAEGIIQAAHKVIMALIREYKPGFTLPVS